MGRSRRRRSRREGGGAPPGGQGPRPGRPAWRRYLDAMGGLPVAGALGLAVVVVIVLIVLNRPKTTVSDAPFTPIARADVSGVTWGNPNAPVKMIEFADFQCPFCRHFTEDTEPIIAKQYIETGKVQLIFHNYAFIGAESKAAAAAAACAADQNHFWDFHDLLYLRQGSTENSGAFSTQHLKDFGQQLHDAIPDFDVAAFDTCVDSGTKASLVDEESQQATAAGVQSTPSFLINGKLLAGAQDFSTFRQAIEEALAAATSTPAASP